MLHLFTHHVADVDQLRDRSQEELNRGKQNWEHLSDELHVLITVEDTENRAQAKMKRAVEEIKKLLVPSVSAAPFVGMIDRVIPLANWTGKPPLIFTRVTGRFR